MKKLSAASRITLGLVCSMLGILISANLLGLLPDRNTLIIKGRQELVESIAFSNSVLLEQGNYAGINAVFANIIARQSDVRSVAYRSYSDHQIEVAAGPHATIWPANQGTTVTEQFMSIPLSKDGFGDCGQLEMAFTPLDSGRWYSFAENPLLQLLLFAACCGFVTFRIFLRLVLKNLDPSRAVPRRVREALDILSEGLMIVSLDGRILLANNAMSQTAGRDADSMIGRAADELSFHRRDGVQEMPWTECGRTQLQVTGVTADFVETSGKTRIFKINCSPLFGNDGKVRGVMVSLDDVTLLEQNKIELRDARDEADAANRAKSDFLANMSHEIRNPMNAIVGFTDILRRGLEESEDTRVRYLDTIHASGTHLVELINDILDFSKIEAGKLDLEIRQCSPYELMMDVVNVLRMKAEQQSLSLSIEVRGVIPETIESDATRLRQILMNLVSNAIKFTAEGGVRIVASTIERGGGEFIRFEVTDTGIGLTKEQIGRLFQQFAQADSSVTRRFGGTGLGLAISKRLTEALGGEISVDSEPGVGSTFHFCVATGNIENVKMLTGTEAAAKFTTASLKTRTGLSTWFQPARILITDDTPANRQLAGVILRKAGLQVDEAENGVIAIEKATTNSYDLLLMDMQMPVMDGFTATSTLRNHGLTQPILAFTANVTEQDRQNCLSSGCTGFLTKPINIDLLLSTIAEYLPTQDHPPEGSEPVPSQIDEAREPAATECIAIGFAPQKSAVDSLDDLLSSIMHDHGAVSPIVEMDVPAAPSLTSKRTRQPLRSTLPMEIPEFRQIVTVFVNGFGETLANLRRAQLHMDYQEIREMAHRLRGTGGTVGFPDFTAPSNTLQSAAEAHDDATIEATVSLLEEIASRLEIDEPAEAEAVTAGSR